jgi:ABC-type multidrug transport system fused ATPase/permease subunit
LIYGVSLASFASRLSIIGLEELIENLGIELNIGKASLGKSLVFKSFQFLSLAEKRKITLITFIQVIASTLDIAGVLALGLLASLSVSPENTLRNVPLYDLIPGLSVKDKAINLILVSCFLLVGRTLISFYITKYTFRFLSVKSASISIQLLESLVKNPNLVLKNSSLQDSLYSLTRGVEYITLQVLTSVILMSADFALLIFMFATFLILDPVISVILVALFLGTSTILYRKLHLKVGQLGERASRLNILANQDIVEIYGLYRELFVTRNLKMKTKKFSSSRLELSEINAVLNFTPYYSKYFIESAFVIFTVFVGVIQYFLTDLRSAITSIVVFLAAGSRLAPAVLRIQQGAIQLRGVVGLASPTFDLISKIKFSQEGSYFSDSEKYEASKLTINIQVKSVSVSYDLGKTNVLNNINLNVSHGEFLAIVGPSGSGKTTLIDTILGIVQPTSGFVKIGEKEPRLAISQWPGSISYVPQSVFITNASIKDNILFGRALDMDDLNRSIEQSGLTDLISSFPDAIDTLIGEGGIQLSGGERQRLGIARALFSRPQLMILDEATSSLDAISEKEISDTLESLRGETTIIVVAHRLSTIKNADKVIYLEGGNLIQEGSFEEIRSQINNFDTQAKLMGL